MTWLTPIVEQHHAESHAYRSAVVEAIAYTRMLAAMGRLASAEERAKFVKGLHRERLAKIDPKLAMLN